MTTPPAAPQPGDEREQARAIANRILDRINADPDDDLAILARQFLRAEEKLLLMPRAPKIR